MRRLVVAAASALALGGCGGSSSSSSSSAPPGVSGTILGQPFTAADASALELSPATCAFDGVNANATGLVVGFGSFSGLCSFVSQHQSCGTKASATTVTVIVVRANVAGGTAPPVQPGTFTIGGASPLPDAQGNVTVAQGIVSKTDASCAQPPNIPDVVSGTVTIGAVGARTSGSVSLGLSDGGKVAGSFDVPTCTGFRTDVCTAVAGGSCASESCVP